MDRAAEQAARDQQRAYVERQFTEAARVAGDVPRGGSTTDYTDLRPDVVREVWVYAHGGWHLGELRAFRKRGDAWEGNVEWTEGIGERYADWLPQDRIKPLT